MSAYNRTFRIECEAARRGSLIDQRTDQEPSVIRGESAEFEIALFQAGIMVPKSNINSIDVLLVDNGGGVLVDWSLSGTDLNASLTAGQWRRGSSQMASFVLTSSDTTALAAGRYTILVKGWLKSNPAGSTGVVFFAEGEFDLVETPEGGLPSSPPSPGPPTSYTKAESDALYAPLGITSDLNDAENEIVGINGWIGRTSGSTDQKFVRAASAQSLTTGEKSQARANIDARLKEQVQLASVGGGGTFTPTPTTHDSFDVSITGDITFANVASISDWTAGRRCSVYIRQDATGGRKVTWGNHYNFPTYAAVDPQPNAVTRLVLLYDGNVIRVTEQEPAVTPEPDVYFKAASRLVTNGSDGVTAWTDLMSGLAVSSTGTTNVAKLANRMAVAFAGSNQLQWTNTRGNGATGLPVAAGGGAIAVVFNSTGSGTNQFLVESNFLGLEVAYNSASGLYIAGVGASSGNRAALAFTPAGSQVKVFVGCIRAAGGGMALDQDGAIAFNSTAAMATPANAANFIGSSGGANHWSGNIAAVMEFTSELTWPQMIALRRALCRYMGI